MEQNLGHQSTPETEVLESNVSPIEVGKTYLKAEMSRLFPSEMTQYVDDMVEGLSEKESWRMLEAMSFTYRLNGIFWFVSDTSYTWSKERVTIANVTLTGMNPPINDVMFSPEINHNPVLFKDYLLEYFGHGRTDNLALEELRPHDEPITRDVLMMIEQEGQLRMLDGTHRLMQFAMRNADTVTAYVGRKTLDGKPRFGDSTFWLLKRAYEKSDPETQQAILMTVRQLMQLSSDGRDAVQFYWVVSSRDETMKAVGELLLEQSPQLDPNT